MSIIILSSIVIAVVVAAIVALSGASQCNKRSQPFELDKAEWQYDTAMNYYCKETGKTPDDLTQEDTDIIWERACNHLSVFLTWATMKGYCGKVHLDEEPEAVRLLDAYYESKYLDEYTEATWNKLQKEPLTFSFSWESFEVYAKMLDRAHRHWKFWEKPVGS